MRFGGACSLVAGSPSQTSVQGPSGQATRERLPWPPGSVSGSLAVWCQEGGGRGREIRAWRQRCGHHGPYQLRTGDPWGAAAPGKGGSLAGPGRLREEGKKAWGFLWDTGSGSDAPEPDSDPDSPEPSRRHKGWRAAEHWVPPQSRAVLVRGRGGESKGTVRLTPGEASGSHEPRTTRPERWLAAGVFLHGTDHDSQEGCVICF